MLEVIRYHVKRLNFSDLNEVAEKIYSDLMIMIETEETVAEVFFTAKDIFDQNFKKSSWI